MPRKILFQVIEYTSADEQYPASALHQHGPFATGWQSSRSCIYPQELVLQFESAIRLKRVQLLSHQYLIGRGERTQIENATLRSFSIENRIFNWRLS